MWILTGLILGSIITSTHDNEEACLGRKAMLEKIHGVSQIECRAANAVTWTSNSLIKLTPNSSSSGTP